MPARKVQIEERTFDADSLRSLLEGLESVEEGLMGFAAITSVDVVLTIEENTVVACHHDGSKWWVKFQ